MAGFDTRARLPPSQQVSGQGAPLLSWKVEVWIQPNREHWANSWTGSRCGPWRHLDTVWVEQWDQIHDVVGDNVGIAGLARRRMYCIEMYEEVMPGHWRPCNTV